MAECSCGSRGLNLLYACSGAANTGFLADAVARKLMNDRVGKMTCLAAIGAEQSGYVSSAGCSEKNVVIDGCPVSCGKKTFERLGLPFEQYVTTDYDVVKGSTEITLDVIERVADRIAEKVTSCGKLS